MATLKELSQESVEDTTFTIKTIDNVMMNNASNYSKWLRYLSEEGLKLKKLKMEESAEYARLYKDYRWDWDFDVKPAEIPALIKGEKSFQSIEAKAEIIIQKLAIIEGTLKAITSLGFNVKNFIEYEKLKSGGY